MPTGAQWLRMAISLVIPGALYWILTSVLLHHGVNFLFSHLLGYGLALMLLAYIQSVFKSDSELSNPIMIIMTFILILSLSLHYLPDYGKGNNSLAGNETKLSSFKSETLTFESTERFLTQKDFTVGTECRITVRGTSVNLVNGSETKELVPEHGTYVFDIMSQGPIIFKGIKNSNNIPSKVTVEWR